MKTLINLAKSLDFSTESEYFDYCIDSYLNGNFSQCKNLFKQMSMKDKKNLLRYIDSSGMLHVDTINTYRYYFDLL